MLRGYAASGAARLFAPKSRVFAVTLGLSFTAISGCTVTPSGDLAALGQPEKARWRPVQTALVGFASQSLKSQAVVEKRAVGYVHQEITYTNQSMTPGENMVAVSYRTGPAVLGLGKGLNPTSISLTEQAKTAFPGARQIGEPLSGQNGLGPFGYVLVQGKSQDRCILARQNRVGAGNAYSIKLRLCLPRGSDERLLGYMRSLQPNYAASA